MDPGLFDYDEVGNAPHDDEITDQGACAKARIGLTMGCTAVGSSNMVAGTLDTRLDNSTVTPSIHPDAFQLPAGKRKGRGV